MKLIHGDRQYDLTAWDGCFAGGACLFVGGLAAAFGWAVLVATVGAGMMLVPFIKLAAMLRRKARVRNDRIASPILGRNGIGGGGRSSDAERSGGR